MTALALIFYYWGDEALVNMYVYKFDLCGENCQGYEGVYRFSFTLFVFFAVHALALLSPRCGISMDRGHWGWKTLVLIIGLIISFLIPNTFFDGYAWVARVASMVFLVFQIILMIDFAEKWNESWVESERYVSILSVTAIFYIACLVLLVLFYKWYTDCGTETFFITMTFIVSTIYTVLSIKTERGAVLPSACVTLYAYYLLYTALASDPKPSCGHLRTDKDDHFQLILGLIVGAASISWAGFSMSQSIEESYGTSQSDERTTPLASAAAGDKGDEESALNAPPADPVVETDDGEEESEDAAQDIARRLRMFHCIMATAAMYMAMLITNWGFAQGEAHNQAYDVSEASMWIKIVSQWLTMILYTWTLVAPLLLDRDFD